MQLILILGRQPALGMSELESLYGPGLVSPWGPNAAVVDLLTEEFSFARLGGSIKSGRVLEVFEGNDLRKLEKTLLSLLPRISSDVSGKIQLGISAYGLSLDPKQLL